MTRHTISVLVENKFGVLARIAGLFSGRGYNIHSLNVAPSQDPRFSRMTIVVREKEDVLDQIIKHLEKLVNTEEVVDFRNTDNVYRETVLTRIGVDSATRHEVIEFCQILGVFTVFFHTQMQRSEVFQNTCCPQTVHGRSQKHACPIVYILQIIDE